MGGWKERRKEDNNLIEGKEKSAVCCSKTEKERF